MLENERQLFEARKQSAAHPLTIFANHCVNDCKVRSPATAEHLFVKALEIQETTYGAACEDRANTMADLAICRDKLGRRQEALEGAQEADTMAKRILPEGNETRRKCAEVLASLEK